MSGRVATVIGLVLLAMLLGTATVPAATAPVPGRDMPLQQTTRGDISDADLWREIRDGAVGSVADPRSQSGLLITPWPRDCVKAGNCSERAVGFTLPVHDLMPPIQVPQGQGPNRETLGFVILLFGGLLLAGVLFVRRLGQPGGPDRED